MLFKSTRGKTRFLNGNLRLRFQKTLNFLICPDQKSAFRFSGTARHGGISCISCCGCWDRVRLGVGAAADRGEENSTGELGMVKHKN